MCKENGRRDKLLVEARLEKGLCMSEWFQKMDDGTELRGAKRVSVLKG